MLVKWTWEFVHLNLFKCLSMAQSASRLQWLLTQCWLCQAFVSGFSTTPEDRTKSIRVCIQFIYVYVHVYVCCPMHCGLVRSGWVYWLQQNTLSIGTSIWTLWICMEWNRIRRMVALAHKRVQECHFHIETPESEPIKQCPLYICRVVADEILQDISIFPPYNRTDCVYVCVCAIENGFGTSCICII